MALASVPPPGRAAPATVVVVVAGVLLGVFLSSEASGGPARAARLLDLVVDALRPAVAS